MQRLGYLLSKVATSVRFVLGGPGLNSGAEKAWRIAWKREIWRTFVVEG